MSEVVDHVLVQDQPAFLDRGEKAPGKEGTDHGHVVCPDCGDVHRAQTDDALFASLEESMGPYQEDGPVYPERGGTLNRDRLPKKPTMRAEPLHDGFWKRLGQCREPI